jgi:hypothetical protein
MPKKRTVMKGISRIDSGSTHGWFVRVYKNTKTFSKLFSDRKIGGKGKALKEAKEHRDKMTAVLDHMELARASHLIK